MNSLQSSDNTMSWGELTKLASKTEEEDRINGSNNAQAILRLFGEVQIEPRVTLYRDNHAWCPYCQKIWLWLEFKRIPYRIKKVTMRCYGKKEGWYLKRVPSGMLPALEIDKRLITESDRIISELEKTFGPLKYEFNSRQSINLRNTERRLFSAWCRWLCIPQQNKDQEKSSQLNMQSILKEIEGIIQSSQGPWIQEDLNLSSAHNNLPGSVDIIFIPFLERMNASLAYYKGFSVREEHPKINSWFQALESLDEYRGTQGDFHTHSHDLPPQMGGCWTFHSCNQEKYSKKINSGEGLGELETTWTAPSNKQAQIIALKRTIKHHEKLLELNPLGRSNFDQPLRAALTFMITGQVCVPNKYSSSGLRYLRDRISVPRDMPLLSARKLRQSLEMTAALDGSEYGESIPTNHRFDQNPKPFNSIN